MSLKISLLKKYISQYVLGYLISLYLYVSLENWFESKTRMQPGVFFFLFFFNLLNFKILTNLFCYNLFFAFCGPLLLVAFSLFKKIDVSEYEKLILKWIFYKKKESNIFNVWAQNRLSAVIKHIDKTKVPHGPPSRFKVPPSTLYYICYQNQL